MFLLTVIPPLVVPGSFSTMKQHTPASVRAASATIVQTPSLWPCAVRSASLLVVA